ncbi:hypothetical protein [Halosolutus gelatinilyticus]|uniref:hypothetical protein n=1 Tax=Halosolutus gelatinilyticus TaxID=2931975 RepID=UPI001FF5F847|nr:hypothetical protein [Halosolutus gelatinilyticus]
MNRSKKANKYGTAVEKKVFSKYGIVPARSSWCDAEFRTTGTPIEIKSAMLRRSNGQPGNFKLYEQYHRRLRRNDGYYIFAVYRPYGRGTRVLKTKLVHSSRVPRLSWHGGGEHRDTRQAKLAIADIF